jgi:hypothetical protein
MATGARNRRGPALADEKEYAHGRREAVLADGSYLSHVYPSERDWRHKTNGIVLRVIDYRLEGIEGSEPIYRLATTILDPGKAQAERVGGSLS